MKHIMILSILFFLQGCGEDSTANALTTTGIQSTTTPPQPQADGDTTPPTSPKLD